MVMENLVCGMKFLLNKKFHCMLRQVHFCLATKLETLLSP